MEKIEETYTVLGQTFDSKELAEAYLDIGENIKKASLDLSNLCNFQKKKLIKIFICNFLIQKILQNFF